MILARALAVLAPLLLLASPVRAQQAPGEAPAERVVAGLSQHQVAITTGFSGSEIFIYGAIKRETPAPEKVPLDVIIAVTGPLKPVIVRKKVRRFGIWVNGPAVEVDTAPVFYAVATTRPFHEAITNTDDLRYRIGIDQLVRLIGSPRDKAYPEDFRQAVIRLRRKAGLYVELPGAVHVTEDTLFETRVRLPANLVEGDYRARIFLLRNRTVVDRFESSIRVRRVGVERWIYVMANEHAALYGALSVFVALFAGWAASALFRYVVR